MQLSNKSQLSNTLKLDFPWAIHIANFFFSHHESIAEILISIQILYNSQSKNISLILPTRRRKEKGLGEEFFLSWVCQKHVFSSSLPNCPLLLSKKITSAICLSECKNYQSMSNSNPSGFRSSHQLKQREHWGQVPSFPRIADGWGVRKPQWSSAQFKVIFQKLQNLSFCFRTVGAEKLQKSTPRKLQALVTGGPALPSSPGSPPPCPWPRTPSRDTGACGCSLGPEKGILEKISFELYSTLARALEISRQCFSSNTPDLWCFGCFRPPFPDSAIQCKIRRTISTVEEIWDPGSYSQSSKYD